jgi:hypothetical protein
VSRGSHSLFEQRSGAVLELLEAGVSIADAAREAGEHRHRERWGPHATFAPHPLKA